MEFHIDTTHINVNPTVVQAMLWQIDPASIVHLDSGGRQLRVSVESDARELLAMLHRIDLAVNAGDITQVPSICCGGCGG